VAEESGENIRKLKMKKLAITKRNLRRRKRQAAKKINIEGGQYYMLSMSAVSINGISRCGGGSYRRHFLLLFSISA